jgi:hypothetical protein
MHVASRVQALTMRRSQGQTSILHSRPPATSIAPALVIMARRVRTLVRISDTMERQPTRPSGLRHLYLRPTRVSSPPAPHSLCGNYQDLKRLTEACHAAKLIAITGACVAAGLHSPRTPAEAHRELLRVTSTEEGSGYAVLDSTRGSDAGAWLQSIARSCRSGPGCRGPRCQPEAHRPRRRGFRSAGRNAGSCRWKGRLQVTRRRVCCRACRWSPAS